MHSGHLAALAVYPFPGWRSASSAILMAACMAGVGWLARRSWLAVGILAGLSVAWLSVDDQMWEMMFLFKVYGNHGATLSDVIGAAGLVASIGLAVRLRRADPGRNRPGGAVRVAVKEDV